MPIADQTILHLPVSHLQPNPLQPRGKIDPEELQDLVSSITKHGILEPLVAAHTPAGYQLIAGERRLRAAKLAGLKEVPVLVKETSPRGMLEMAIIENVQRVDLNPIDRAKAFQRLGMEFHLSTSEIADRIGKSTAYVSNTLRMLTLPDALKDGLLGKQITEGHARALAAIEDVHSMVDAYKTVLKTNASVRTTEDLARRMKVKLMMPASKGVGKAPFISSSEIDNWQDTLQKGFGSRAVVKLVRSRAQTKISIVLNGNVDETQEPLNKFLRLVRQHMIPQK